MTMSRHAGRKPAGSKRRESTTSYMLCTYACLPIPLGVDLAEVDAVLDDAAATGEEEHVAVGEPELEGERAERQEEQQVEAPRRPQRQAPRLPPRLRHLRHQRPVQQVLRTYIGRNKQAKTKISNLLRTSSTDDDEQEIASVKLTAMAGAADESDRQCLLAL